jgi:phosphoadenosine phosphosulfate reductase
LIAEVHASWGDERARVLIDTIEDTLAQLHRVHSDATAMPIETADERAFEITKAAWQEYDDHLVLWTGGKDSTAMLHYLKEHRYVDFEALDVLFVDHGMHFDEVIAFVEAINYDWLGEEQLIEAKNEPFFEYIPDDAAVLDDDGEPKHHVPTSALPDRQQAELERTADAEDRALPHKIPWSTNTFWGNHTLKTIPLKQTIEDGDYDAVWAGIRKDEGEARAGSEPTEPREQPAHTRIHPLVHFTEPQLWAYIKREFVPYCELYEPEHGYASLGAEPFTDPVPNVQPLEAAEQGERAGRAQNKEDGDVMAALRRQGYM